MAKKIDRNGFWLIEENPITKEGVFPYLGCQIDATGSLGLSPTKIYSVYRPADELQKEETVKSFSGVPFLNGHEMIGDGCTEYDARPAGGVLLNVKQGIINGVKGLVGDIRLFSESIKSLIEQGKKQLSLGYRCEWVPKRGVFAGQAYDFIQRNIIGNHVALVDRGRMGSDVRVYDHAVCFDSMEVIPMAKVKDSEFRESEHKRDSDGKFSETGGSAKKQKEPWQMTKKEINSLKTNSEYQGSGVYRWTDSKGTKRMLAPGDHEAHKNLIERAVSAGESVPDDVLADYPDLKKSQAQDAEQSEGNAKMEEIKNLMAEWLKDKATPEQSQQIMDALNAIGQSEAAPVAPVEQPAEEKPAEEAKPAEEKPEEEAKPVEENPVEDAPAEEQKPEGEEKKKEAPAMDEAIKAAMKEITARNALVEQVKPLIGSFACDEMTEEQVAEYACSKLKLDFAKGQSKAMLKGYLAGRSGGVAMDAAVPKKVQGEDAALKKYLAQK